LEPSKVSGAYDEQYAGINSVFTGGKSKELLGFFHAERPTGGNNEHGTLNFYATIGLAVSKGNSAEKTGPVLTGAPQDAASTRTAQGHANPSVCLDHTGKWLYLYYTDHRRVDPATGKTRSVITCMARSKVEDRGRPGTWYKFYKGDFTEPGLGGKDTEVADCYAANVTYIPEMKTYVMLANRGCVGFFTSDDGIKWDNPRILFKMGDVPQIGREIAIHLSLFIQQATAKEAVGFIFYAYSPNYGHEKPAKNCNVAWQHSQ
jgi:hypothetical protein